MNEFINKKYTYALIGASNNKEKYGNKVFRDLLGSMFNIIPINPKSKEIEGEKSYPSILDTKDSIDVAITIIPPSATEKTISDIAKKGINKVWMQPGSESKKAIELCKKHNINVISDKCIMVERRKYEWWTITKTS